MADVQSWVEILRKGKFLEEAALRELCALAKSRLIEQPTLRPVSAPVNVCGDVHGQVRRAGVISSPPWLIDIYFVVLAPRAPPV